MLHTLQVCPPSENRDCGWGLGAPKIGLKLNIRRTSRPDAKIENQDNILTKYTWQRYVEFQNWPYGLEIFFSGSLINEEPYDQVLGPNTILVL